jgi:hypothetical protein
MAAEEEITEAMMDAMLMRERERERGKALSLSLVPCHP